MRDVACNFCGDKAVYDGKTLRGPWAYACEQCKDMLYSNFRKKLPRGGTEGVGHSMAAKARYDVDEDAAYATCKCGHEQGVEPDAESAYCQDCGMLLKFKSPLDSVFEME